jgi:hypothetical protein
MGSETQSVRYAWAGERAAGTAAGVEGWRWVYEGPSCQRRENRREDGWERCG